MTSAIRYRSTKGASPTFSFADAILLGQAPDGGLFVPIEIPTFSSQQASFVEMASEWLRREFQIEVIEAVVQKSLNFPIPLVEVTKDRYVLELFHGPTLSFKDVGARFLAAFLNHVLEERDGHATVLTATSGDTGSAVADAFGGLERIQTYILFPQGKVTPIQERQIILKRKNVTPIAVQGVFDDCQSLIKQAMKDPSLHSLHLTSANSINVGRLLPQSFYYLHAAQSLLGEREGEILCSVPSGNFGNLMAGFFAKQTGARLKFIAATNANDIVPHYLRTGIFQPKPSRETFSSAMDVGNPSNFDRFRDFFHDDLEVIRSELFTTITTDSETLATIKHVFEAYGYLLDPHGAVAWHGVEQVLAQEGKRSQPIVSLATAHPAKFPEVIEQAIGKTPEVPSMLQGQLLQPSHRIELSNHYDDFKQLLLAHR